MKEYRNSNGQYHREDGPAVILPDGTKQWFKNGKFHRENDPAVIEPDGTQYWFINNELHREDGPAIIYSDGTQKWYLCGKKYSELEFYKELHLRGIITEQELFLKLL